MIRESIIWTNFADGETVYKMFKDYGISRNVSCSEKITYVRFSVLGTCSFRWTPQGNTVENERDAYEEWIARGYKELKMFEEDKEYVGTI